MEQSKTSILADGTNTLEIFNKLKSLNNQPGAVDFAWYFWNAKVAAASLGDSTILNDELILEIENQLDKDLPITDYQMYRYADFVYKLMKSADKNNL